MFVFTCVPFILDSLDNETLHAVIHRGAMTELHRFRHGAPSFIPAQPSRLLLADGCKNVRL